MFRDAGLHSAVGCVALTIALGATPGCGGNKDRTRPPPASLDHDGEPADPQQWPDDEADADVSGELSGAPAPISDEQRSDYEIFDPGAVYLFGTVIEGSCGNDAIASPLSPDVGSIGFECNANVAVDNAKIRPTDGRVLYLVGTENVLREFHCDGACGAGPKGYKGLDTLFNDPVLTAPGCPDDKVDKFDFSSDGARYHVCKSERAWRNEAGEVVFENGDGNTVLGFHSSGVVLSSSFSDLYLHDLNDVAQAPVHVPPPQNRAFLAARPTSSGFWIVYGSSKLTDPLELWQLAFDGTLMQVDGYGVPPEGITVNLAGILDAEGQLWQEAKGVDGIDDVILRRTPGAEAAEVVYDEANDPLVKMEISSLFSGASE